MTDSAIVGIGELPQGKMPGVTPMGLHTTLARMALEDAGLKARDVDAIITLSPRSDPDLIHATALAEFMGIAPPVARTGEGGGAAPDGEACRADGGHQPHLPQLPLRLGQLNVQVHPSHAGRPPLLQLQFPVRLTCSAAALMQPSGRAAWAGRAGRRHQQPCPPQPLHRLAAEQAWAGGGGAQRRARWPVDAPVP